MKRFLSLACAAILLCGMLAMPLTAHAADGATFSSVETYTTESAVSAAPLTMEAVIKVPKSISGRAGVIFGNYNNKQISTNFEITSNGVPRFYGWASSSAITDLKFDKVDVRTGDFVHLAITLDAAAGKMHCYLNGELKQSLSCSGYKGLISPNPYMIGGDLRSGNERYFQGEIKSVAIYGDLRTADEIKAAMTKLDTADSALLMAYDLTVSGAARLADLSGKGVDLVYSNPHASLESAGGLIMDDNTMYFLDKKFDTAPATFEAWINVPKGYDARGGVIIGNYGGETACLNFEVYSSGNPRLYYVNAAGTKKNVVFSNVDVRTGDWAHLTIVHDSAAQNLKCYLNGELKQTVTGVAAFESSILNSKYGLGGDCRTGNGQFFKGAIRSVAVFSDARTADEIKADMNAVSANADGLLAYYDTSATKAGEDVKDLSPNGYNAACFRPWFKDKEPVTDYAYSFCVVGDTQKVAYLYPDKFDCIYNWIVENKESKKIEFVFGLGDITDKDTAAEWTVAKNGISKLNGVVPYSLVRGNHDGSAMYNKTFGVEEYTKQFNGFFKSGKIENSWRTFSVGEVDYLHITMDYGASDAILNWAAGIIEQHPTHRVIITTHAYLFRDGTTLDVGDVVPPNKTGVDNGVLNNGDMMWDKLISKYENIFLVMSGHDPCDNIIVAQDKGVHGNIVTQMLVDPQGVDAAQGATGMVAMLYFSNDGKTVTIENYSTVRDEFYMQSSQMVIQVPEYNKSATPAETTPAAPAETTPAPESDDTTTAIPTETTPASPETTPADTDTKSGCGSVAMSAALMALAAAAVVIRKRKGE